MELGLQRKRALVTGSTAGIGLAMARLLAEEGDGVVVNGRAVERVRGPAEDDWRRGSPEFQSPHVERNLALRDALGPVAERHDASIASVAVAWTLAWLELTGAIVGARTPQQVDGWIPAASLELTGEDLDQIAGAITRMGAGGGPAQPKGR